MAFERALNTLVQCRQDSQSNDGKHRPICSHSASSFRRTRESVIPCSSRFGCLPRNGRWMLLTRCVSKHRLQGMLSNWDIARLATSLHQKLLKGIN